MSSSPPSRCSSASVTPPSASLDVRWWLTEPGRAAATTSPPTCPAPSSWTWTRTSPHPPARAVIPSPTRPCSPPAWRRSGVGDDSDVVVYDDAGGIVAARLWWMLDDLGHRAGPRPRRRPRRLAGGRRTGDAERAAASAPGRLTLARRAGRGRSTGRRSIRRWGPSPLIDARAPERYRGDVEPVDASPRPHPDRGQPADRRQPRRRTAGSSTPASSAPASRPPAARSSPRAGAGSTACHNALAMRVAGLPDSAALPRLVQRLVADGDAGGHGRGAGLAAGRRRGQLTPAGPCLCSRTLAVGPGLRSRTLAVEPADGRDRSLRLRQIAGANAPRAPARRPRRAPPRTRSRGRPAA